jgi:hypothetical protein
MIIIYEPLNAEERQRNDNLPVGLKNIGNSKILRYDDFIL